MGVAMCQLVFVHAVPTATCRARVASDNEGNHHVQEEVCLASMRYNI